MKKLYLFSVGALSLVTAGAIAAKDTRTVLPIPNAPFDGEIAKNRLDAKPGTPHRILAPAGAPNVFLFMSDDVGFSMSSAFGGPVPTPNMERIAAKGQRYNRFHTTSICSPSRAALLTGRNHHKAGIGYLSDLTTDFPGYGGRILPETATIAQILRLNGYNTAMFGKHHNTPPHDRSDAGPFDSWPTGLGFEYFFGFVSGDSDQFLPNLYRGTNRIESSKASGKLVDERLADDIIRYVHNQNAAAPDKPFLLYFAPGSTHAPHQAPPEYIARFKGLFDSGWDKQREETYRRQVEGAIIPRNTKLTPRPKEIPAWNSLKPAQKAFAIRAMEVAAAQLAFQDKQLGRVIDELERMGELDNSLIAIINGDNGASAEAGPRGTLNEMRSLGGSHSEREEWLTGNLDKMGGPQTYQSYPAGWTWAMNTPLRWTKQYASMLGGIRNGMIMSYTGHVSKPGGICSQFGHLVDLAPTVLEAAQLPEPVSVLGTKQLSMDGTSLLSSLAKCEPDKPRTQYFELGGKIGLYHNNWFLSGDDGRVPWKNVPPEGERPKTKWSLYNLKQDFSQSQDLSTEQPKRLQQMIGLWDQEAKQNNVYPLDHRFGLGRADFTSAGSGRKHYEFWGKDISLPANGQPLMIARSFTVNIDLDLDKPNASGVILALGSQFGGWSLYLDKGRPAFTWARSTDPQEIHTIQTDKILPKGKVSLRMRFATEKPGAPADVILSSDGEEFGKVRLRSNILIPAGGGETMDIGRDLGVPVTGYHTRQGNIEGNILRVTIDFD